MWDLATIKRINEVAAAQAEKGLPESDALYIATGIRDVNKKELVTFRVNGVEVKEV